MSTPVLHVEERLLSAREVADFLGVTPRWVMEKYRAGDLPGAQLHGSNRARFWLSEIVATMTRPKGGV
jgi:predicted DNA-binding transcriptional regulator AlpA